MPCYQYLDLSLEAGQIWMERNIFRHCSEKNVLFGLFGLQSMYSLSEHLLSGYSNDSYPSAWEIFEGLNFASKPGVKVVVKSLMVLVIKFLNIKKYIFFLFYYFPSLYVNH